MAEALLKCRRLSRFRGRHLFITAQTSIDNRKLYEYPPKAFSSEAIKSLYID
jgi:hypothetical protein